VSISQLIAAKIGKLGENIAVRRFARFKVGDVNATVAFVNPKSENEGGEASSPVGK
jgi:elongation factor Ts